MIKERERKEEIKSGSDRIIEDCNCWDAMSHLSCISLNWVLCRTSAFPPPDFYANSFKPVSLPCLSCSRPGFNEDLERNLSQSSTLFGFWPEMGCSSAKIWALVTISRISFLVKMSWAKLLLLCCRQKQTRLDFSVWHMLITFSSCKFVTRDVL